MSDGSSTENVVIGDRLLTVDQLVAEIGLTSRTIRAYHARGLLPPPIRKGRTPYYGAAHLSRLRRIVTLQSRGLPLEAIRAVLEPDTALADWLLPGPQITRALRAEPALVDRLCGAGVLTVRADGGLELRSARAVLAAFAVSGADLPIRVALHALAGSVTAVRPLADATLALVRAEVVRHVADIGHDQRGLRDFAVEVVRLCLTR